MSKRMRGISPLAPAESTAMTLEDAEANVSDGTAFIVLNLARGQGTSFLSGESRMADGSFEFAAAASSIGMKDREGRAKKHAIGASSFERVTVAR
jgi:hypothetical protein